MGNILRKTVLVLALLALPLAARASEDDKTDYRALAQAIEGAMRAGLYAEEAVNHPRTQMFFLDLATTAEAGGGRDAFLATVKRHEDRLPFSHMSLRPPADPDRPRRASNDTPNFKLEELERGIFVLTVRAWNVELKQVTAAVEEIVAKDARALILDLRENRGGTYSSGFLGSYLLTEPAISGLLFARPVRAPVLAGQWDRFPKVPVTTIESVDRLGEIIRESGAFALAVEPLEPHYAGPVYALTSHKTASANEPMLAALKRDGRITIVGEPTAGEMLSSETVDVGQGWSLTMPVLDYVTGDGVRLDLRGVAPDILVPADRAMARALDEIAAEAAD